MRTRSPHDYILEKAKWIGRTRKELDENTLLLYGVIAYLDKYGKRVPIKK